MLAHRKMVLAALSALWLGCGSSEGPRFEALDHQVAAVGQELVVELLASNDDGSAISYSYDTDAPNLGDRASLTQRPGGASVFAWTPTAEDIGTWTFDFHAIDAHGQSTESITIEVRSAVGSQTLPQFRRPLGAGTALNTAGDDCVEIEIVIEDQDTAAVTISEAEPKIEGAELLQDSDTDALWRWCPTPAQIAAQDRYLLTIHADDGENPAAVKRYQIVLRDHGDKSECSGSAPTVRHTAQNFSTLGPIEITASVSDDTGLKGAPFLYYSLDRPSDPPDLSSMIQLPFRLAAGDPTEGTYSVTVPNPLAEPGAAVTDATLYYVIVAEDNDDKGGRCDHVVTSPFQALVQSPDVPEAGAGLCEPCTSDAQCGDADDLCLGVGVEGESFCFQSCDGPGTCPDGYICSPAAMTSREGGSARQCIPITESCAGGASCADDAFEHNDGQGEAKLVETGTAEDLRMCPLGDLGGDEDWYTIEVTEDAQVELTIGFPLEAPSPLPTFPDLNLRLFDEQGRVIAVSEDAIDPYSGIIQGVTRCLTPGTYYVRVYSYFSGEHDYQLTYTQTPSTCSAGTCTDDVFEEDDGLADARVPNFESSPVFRSSDNQICTGDDDWYSVYVFGDEQIYVSLTFDQAGPSEDLDILVYDGVGTLITPCTEEDVTGCSDNGQSATANEYMVYKPSDYGAEGGQTYFVVHGFDGAENDYDICIALEPGHCEL